MHDNYCARCHGVRKIVFGALILLNAFVWPMWTGLEGWIKWLGVLLVLGGIITVAMPSCGHKEAPARKR